MADSSFDPSTYKRTTRDQWDASGAGYDAWGATIQSVIRPAAEEMLETMGVDEGSSVLGPLSQPDGAHLRQRADGFRDAFAHGGDAGNESRGNGTESGH